MMINSSSSTGYLKSATACREFRADLVFNDMASSYNLLWRNDDCPTGG